MTTTGARIEANGRVFLQLGPEIAGCLRQIKLSAPELYRLGPRAVIRCAPWLDSLMRRRLQKFLPVVLIALAVQILAPIAASWAAAAAASDPLQAAEICHSLAPDGTGQGDQGSGPNAHDGACLICCAAQASSSLDAPQFVAFQAPYRQTTHVVWNLAASDAQSSRSGSNTQARAPPLPM
jgi:hypothetical protein